MKDASPQVRFAVVEATDPNEASANAPIASAPLYVPNAPSPFSHSATLATGLCPMISNVLPNPAAMQLGGDGAPLVLHIFTNQPQNSGDLATWGSNMPRLREDA